MTVTVVINEQHDLYCQQESVIVEKFGGPYIRRNIPAEGMNLSQLTELADELAEQEEDVLIVSPIPALIKRLAQQGKEFYVFHNDRREKKQLPNGKVVLTVAEEGWVIV